MVSLFPMVWNNVQWSKALRTLYVRGVPRDVQHKREQLIDEALGWERGESIEAPKYYHLQPLSDGSAVYFAKPGKEFKEGKNVNDMRPVVKDSDQKPPTFAAVWSDLTNIALLDFEAFRAVLLLVYRNAFLMDHELQDGHWRYNPQKEIHQCIIELNEIVGPIPMYGSVEGLLRFIDLLGWNEDVKYLGPNKRGKKRIGRINTFLTCIRIPYQTALFMGEHQREVQSGGSADYTPLYDIMQALIKSRGICLPSKEDLLQILNPYLLEKSEMSIGTVARTIPQHQKIITNNLDSSQP